jgi:hypothetical protein
MASVVTEFIRRIEKIILGSRPKIPPIGTNHVDDYSQWTNDTIYKGELGINLEDGNLFTQDGRQIVELNTEDAIIDGHILQTSGVSSQYLSVTQGKIRIDGKTYYTPTPELVTDTNIFIEVNTTSYPRIDTICIKGDPTLYYASQDLYGTEFRVVKGTPAIHPEPPDVPSGYYFIGVCWVYPNSLPIYSTLYPLSYSLGSLSTFPLPVITTKDFVQRRRLTVHLWEYNTLYFSQQIVKYEQQLYWVIKTHQSSGSSIQDDINSGKIVKICCGGSGSSGGQGLQGNAFNDIGGVPTDGSWADGIFSWTGTTLILDAFDDINEFLKNYTTETPSSIPSNILTIEMKNGFSARWYDSGSLEDYVFTDQELPVVRSTKAFRSYESGIVNGYADFNGDNQSTSNHTVSATVHPPATNYIVTGDDLSLYLEKDDAFSGDENLEGKLFNVYTYELSKTGSFLAASDTIVNIMGIEYNSFHGYGNAEINFYVEQIGSSPTLTSISVNGVWTSKYVSGVPVLQEGDIINFSFDAENCVGYFYHKDHIVKVLGPNVDEKLLPQTDPSCTTSLPFTALTEVVNFTDAEAIVSENAFNTSLTQTFDLSVHNAKGTGTIGKTDITTSSYKIFIDDISQELNNRYSSGTGLYPTTGYGNIYNYAKTQESLYANEELQMWCGSYRYPDGDYTSADMNASGPDYTGFNGIRWATFNLGEIENQKYVTFLIKNATNIKQDFVDGIKMSDNLYLQVRVDGSSPTLGWVNANVAYNPIIVQNPTNDGDAALDVGNSNATLRRVTFGEESKSGTVHIRIGFNELGNVEFSDIINYELESKNQDWVYFTIGSINNASNVTINIENSNGTITEDFTDGMRMTNNFDLQVKVVGISGTDWLDGNYRYISGNPENFGDAALDVNNSTAISRKITFGSTNRTGEVKVRMRGNYKVFSGITSI